MRTILFAIISTMIYGQIYNAPYYDGLPSIVPYWLPRTVHPEVIGTVTTPNIDPARFYTDISPPHFFQGPILCGFNYFGVPQLCQGPVVVVPPQFYTNFKPTSFFPVTQPVVGPIVDPQYSIPAVITPPISQDVVTPNVINTVVDPDAFGPLPPIVTSGIAPIINKVNVAPPMVHLP